MFSFIPDNEDLLRFSATLRVELEYLIYTIEQHRSITGHRYIKARERFAAGLVTFLNNAILSQPHTDDSAIAGSELAPMESTSADAENPDPAPTTGALSAIGLSEIRSDAHSTEDGEEKFVKLESSIGLHDGIPTEPKTTTYDTDSDQNSIPPPSARMQKKLMEGIKSKPTPPVTQFHTETLPAENRSLWIPDVPAQIRLSQVYDQLCGGAIERVESFPHKQSNGYGVSVTFVEHSDAKRYLDYVHTPQGRIVFRGVPDTWKYDVLWNPRPLQMHYRVMSMAHDPYVRARRCLIIKNFPVELMDAEMLVLKLRKLGGNFSRFPRVQKVSVDHKSKEATIHMDRISCTIQLMEAKICGKWGEEFEHCTLTFGRDECERPIPCMREEGPFGGIHETAHTVMTKAQTDIYIKNNVDPQYGFYRSQQDFRKMRSLYISMLPSTTTISDLVAQIRGGALERITLNRKPNGMLKASITFVHHSSAQAWYEYTTTPSGRIRFPNVVWDWCVRWETSIELIGRDMWHDVMNPAIKARRGFVIKNLSSHQEISAETLKEDVLSQSNKRLSFEKFEINRKKREARVIMASIGSAMGGITMIRRLGRYKGCRIEFLKDECENPIPLINAVEEQQKAASITTTANDINVVSRNISQPPIYTKTLLVKHLPASITLRQLSSRIRGGALDNLQIRTCCGLVDCLASITFSNRCAAENYFTHITTTSTTKIDISWGRDIATKSTGVLSRDVKRVLIVKGFPSVFRESNIILAIEKVVKHSAWLLKISQNNTIESITVNGKERKVARVVLASVKLAVLAKAGLSRFWSSEFGRDDCEGPLTELAAARAIVDREQR